MLTRRRFIKILAALFGSTAVGAYERTLLAAGPVNAGGFSPANLTQLGATATPMPSDTPTATVVPSATASPAETVPYAATTTRPELVTVRGDQFYYRGELFPIRGFNYYPRLHPWRTFNIGEWDPTGTEHELALAVGLGANTVRIFIDYQWSLDNSKVQQPKDLYFAPIARYVENVREFLDIAGRMGLKVIVTLFDSLDWVIYQSQSQWIAEEYLKELVPAFVDNPNILCWDLQNEPDRAIALTGPNTVIPFFQRISKIIRSIDPNHLQTIGWIDRARGKYFPDLDPLLDFWCFHFYDNAANLDGLVRFYKPKTRKPMLLEEYGLATGGPGADGQHSEADQAAHFNVILDTLDKNQMCGSVFWCLVDFPIGLAGNPPSPNDSPEDHFGVFRLDYSDKPAAAELRKFWKATPPS